MFILFGAQESGKVRYGREAQVRRLVQHPVNEDEGLT